MHGAFRYVIACSVCTFIQELLIALAHPSFMFPNPAVIVTGMASLLNISETGCHILLQAWVFAWITMIYINAAMFLFRYGQTVDNRALKLLGKPRYALTSAVLLLGLFGAGIIIPMQLSWVSEAVIKEAVYREDRQLFEMMEDKRVFGAEVRLSGRLCLPKWVFR